MPKVVDLTGQRFSRLLVLSRTENSSDGKARWLCQCDCGKQKIVTGNNLRTGAVKSCRCLHSEVMRERFKQTPVEIRFWSLVSVGLPDECWEWKRLSTNSYGYGRLSVDGTMQLAHRVAWALHHGREPERFVLHHCDNPLCCNPAHLYEGDRLDNVQDMCLAGRARNRYTGPMTPAEELATRGRR